MIKVNQTKNENNVRDQGLIAFNMQNRPQILIRSWPGQGLIMVA